MIIDSTKIVKGSILPDFKFQTQKKNLTEFENLADISVKLGKGHAITIANKIELSKYGSETLLSGGYLYAEYRRILDNKMVIEPFSQVQWAEARGMERKYAGGINLRYRIYLEEKIGLFAGIGPFYEFERWNYDGVPEDVILPPDLSTISNSFFKLGTYVSGKLEIAENLFLDISLYHQAKYDELFSTPRLANSAAVTISLTKYLGFNIIHQFIYDLKPVVPIDKDFHKIILGFSLDF